MLKRWWMVSDSMLPARVALWWVRWKLRGHNKNHDGGFCRHKTKVWRWEMADGCRGLVCDWCHLLEPWCPTSMPDVSELVRVKDGVPDFGWQPRPLVERFCEAWERLEIDLQPARRMA